MEKEVLIFGDQCINKNVVHTNKIPISIDKVEIKRKILYVYKNNKIHMVKKIYS